MTPPPRLSLSLSLWSFFNTRENGPNETTRWRRQWFSSENCARNSQSTRARAQEPRGVPSCGGLLSLRLPVACLKSFLPSNLYLVSFLLCHSRFSAVFRFYFHSKAGWGAVAVVSLKGYASNSSKTIDFAIFEESCEQLELW